MNLRQGACLLLLVASVFLAAPTSPAQAALAGVSSVDPVIVDPTFDQIVAGDATTIPPNVAALNIGNGFPLWYQDGDGRKLELCLEQQKIDANTLVPFFPCLTAEPIATRPIAFPGNFGPEGFYWSAVAADTFTSSDGTLGDMLLVMGHEVTFPTGIITDGQQTVFARIRLRINLPLPGTYRVTHPFGSFDYTVVNAAPGDDREINQTQDVGILAPLDFLASLANGPVPAVGAPTDPSIDEGVVNSDGASVGPYLGDGAAPFLLGVDGATILDTEGNLYLASPGTDVVPNFVTLEQGLNGVDYFELELLDPPAGFFLNNNDPLNPSQIVRLDQFQVSGKLFNDGPNLAPLGVADAASTLVGRTLLIDVTANDEDLRAINLANPFDPADPANTNVHAINPEAVVLVNPADGSLLTRTATLTTALGATVRRVVDAPTGRALLFYTPGDPGEDSFSYVVQDRGGLLSQPTTVSVLVEDLTVDRAEFRPETGKWRIEGTSNDITANGISLFTAPRAVLSGASEVPAVTSEAQGSTSLRISDTTIGYQLAVAPLPVTEVTGIHIHLGNPGEEGAILFSLYDSLFDPAFTGSLAGQLNAGNLAPDPANGINTFADALQAIVDGRTYVNVHTTDNPGGEIRGQLMRTQIGTAPVESDRSWSFNGRAQAAPGRQPSLSITSANGNQVHGIDVKFR